MTYHEEFLELWALWDKKQKKAESQEAWKMKPLDCPPHSELKAILKQHRDWHRANTELPFIPCLVSWFAGRRWEDELESPEHERAKLIQQRAESFGFVDTRYLQ